MNRTIRIAAVTVAMLASFVAGRAVAPNATADAQGMTLSHFRCYAAGSFIGTTAHAVAVELKDQFGPPVNAIVSRPELFCAPVLKKLERTKPQPFPQPADHLTCYDAPGKTIETVRTGQNQLGKVQVRDLIPRLLCVPTHKFELKPNG